MALYRSAGLAGLFVLSLFGCQPQIGDGCSTSTDCSVSGERLCDVTQPGGYCTIFGCEPGSCPEEATCVAFGAVLSTAPACRGPHAPSRLRRTFCMRACEETAECRPGYECRDLSTTDNEWGAVVVDDDSRLSSVCLLPASGEQPEVEGDGGYCVGTDGVFDLPEPQGDAGGAGTDPGSDAGDGESDASDGEPDSG